MYRPSIHFRRTPAEKSDLLLSWKREDKAFFAAGACHILAYAFMKLHPNEGFYIVHIKPLKGFSGNHIYITNGIWAFDYEGWTEETELLNETEKIYKATYPKWDFDRVIIDTDLESFCNTSNHRLPTNFAFLPWDRAFNYIKKYPPLPPN